MFLIVFVMFLVLVLAALVMTFAAYPNRGHDVPGAAWLTPALNRAVDALPHLANPDGVPGPAGEVRDERSLARERPRTPQGSTRPR